MLETLTVVAVDVVIFSVVGTTGAFCGGTFVGRGLKSISGISGFLPLLPESILEILG